MSASTAADRRFGKWSAWIVVVVWLAYVATGIAWLLFGGDAAQRDPGTPLDPFRTVLEILMSLAALGMLALMAAVHRAAPLGAKATSLAALGFMVLMVGTTCGIHFVELTVVRRIEPARDPALSVLFFTRWPSVFFALDLLAWDLFLGLSLLLAAPAFKGVGLEAAVRLAMILGGALCVAGILGPALGDLRFQLLGIAGYAAVFPLACLMLAILYGRAEPGAAADSGRSVAAAAELNVMQRSTAVR
jgi:hypothetical protein